MRDIIQHDKRHPSPVIMPCIDTTSVTVKHNDTTTSNINAISNTNATSTKLSIDTTPSHTNATNDKVHIVNTTVYPDDNRKTTEAPQDVITKEPSDSYDRPY